MWKLYLKKLWLTAQFAAGFLYASVLYGVLFSVFFLTRLPLQKLIPIKTLIAILAIFTLLVLIAYVYRVRRNDKSGRRAYTKKLSFPLPTFGKDFGQTLKSRETLAHTLAFLTLDFPLAVYFGISGFSSVGKFLLEVLLLLIAQGAAFTLINTYLWCLAHRRWIAYWQNHAG